MEKLLLAICLLAALANIPSHRGDSWEEWEIRLHAGEHLRVDLRIESSGPVEWRLLLRGRILTYRNSGCIARWRPCHA